MPDGTTPQRPLSPNMLRPSKARSMRRAVCISTTSACTCSAARKGNKRKVPCAASTHSDWYPGPLIVSPVKEFSVDGMVPLS